MKILAVGDIHTKTWIIDMVESVVNDYDGIVFCGDYADNWGATAQESVNTWKRLKSFADRYPDKVKLVIGNHDYAYLHKVLCSGHNFLAEQMLNFYENRHLKDWLYSLPITLEIDGVIYAHAGIDENWDGETMWKDSSPLWTRPDWAKYKNIKQVVGHTPQYTVTETQPGIWLIDTFSQYTNGEPIGDGSMLVVTNGETFEKIQIDANHYGPTSFEGRVS